MENNEKSLRQQLPAGCVLAPIHACNEDIPLRICVLARLEPLVASGPFILLRELPEARVYLGCVCDAGEQIQDWVEIWVQTHELRDLAYSGYQERLSNFVCDERWDLEWLAYRDNLPEGVITTGMEKTNPVPILMKRHTARADAGLAATATANWRICKDDALLAACGLPPYSTSSFRYLHDPESSGAKTFLATSPDAPVNSQVQPISQLSAAADVVAVFNPEAGLIRVSRFCPLDTEDYLQILEGRPWPGPTAGGAPVFPAKSYAELQAWSASGKGLPFMLHGDGHEGDRLNEVFYLKLSALHAMFKQVRNYVKARQLPLLNLSPSSFRMAVPAVGDQFPALWTTNCTLVKTGQAYPLQIKSTEQKYFIRLGRIEPSTFLPAGLGAHSFGVGSVRIRTVTTETDGIILEGTLVAEEYFTLEAHDLLWFKLPLGEERLEFFAHVYAAESVGPKEARFRTVPVKLPESLNESLKRFAGMVFAKSPYEVWPLLSSPCDLFSLGVMAVRILLANSTSNFPVILDEVLGLARHFGNEFKEEGAFLAEFKSFLDHDQQILDLVSPHKLTETCRLPHQARAQIDLEIWLDTIGLVLRLFPGTGSQALCKDFGDVSPLALETVFNHPVQRLELLILRLRSILAPSLSTNEEIAGVLLKQLAAL
jgi:hypothetical protein